MSKTLKVYLFIVALTIVAGIIAMPPEATITIPVINKTITLRSPRFTFNTAEGPKTVAFEIKRGLDIQGGMQITLGADMSLIPEVDRAQALESTREVITRRVDLYGIAEPSVRTAVSNDTYRLVIELPGVTNPDEALQLVGQTAKLEFMLIKPLEATDSASASLSQIQQAY